MIGASKLKISQVTLTKHLIGWFFIRKLGYDIVYLCIKFDDSSFCRSRDITEGPKIYKKLCYCRGTARRAMFVHSCYVLRGRAYGS